MSALMAERRDWAEDPRQASLFDALAPPVEPAKPAEQAPPAPPEARVVEFRRRREVAAPTDQDPTAEASAADAPTTSALTPADAATVAPCPSDEAAARVAANPPTSPVPAANLGAARMPAV